MNSDPERKNRMGRPNQPPQPECCREEGQATAPDGAGAEQPPGGVHRDRREPQAGVASRLSHSAPKRSDAGGEGVIPPKAHTEETAHGEVSKGLPGSQSVARAEDETWNLRGPADPRRTNCGSQAGKSNQRQEERTDGKPGFRSVHSSAGARPRGPDPHEGTDTSTQPAKETSAVRATDSHWRTSLRAIATKAAQEPHHRFGGLYRLLTVNSLRDCFYQLRKDAAPGIDGVTFEEYEKNLEANLRELERRLKQKSYHARLVRRKYIPKSPGKLRPLGIPVLEDKLVQEAVAQILSAIYEADFWPCSYGYRPNRSARDAVRELTDTLFYGRYEYVFEADIKGYFEHIDWNWLVKMLALRVNDGALLGLICKWLRAGILEEDGRVLQPESGTPQGGTVSPILANVYLHYVLDLWFERRVKKQSKGGCVLFRYADDFVVAFGWRHEAEQFARDLQARLKSFGLELALDKTKTLRFGRHGGGHNGRFDFLGFEFRWENSRAGRPVVKRRTAPKKLRAAVARFTQWMRSHRHDKLCELMETLRLKLQGHWNYYGLIGNSKGLHQYWQQTTRLVFKWLNRRGQRRSYRWRSFGRMLERFKIHHPRLRSGASEGMRELSRWTDQHQERLARVNLFGAAHVAAGARAS